MSDRLNKFFQMQEALMKRYAEQDKSFPKWPINIASKADQKFVRDTLINSADEIFESSRELKNHKQHRLTQISDFDKSKFLEEIIDAYKFMLEALILCEITPDEFERAFIEKDIKCHERLDKKY